MAPGQRQPVTSLAGGQDSKLGHCKEGAEVDGACKAPVGAPSDEPAAAQGAVEVYGDRAAMSKSRAG
jgi:hypothetical protein